MADGDKITIDQINWDDSNLPKWATEATQLKIAKALGAELKDGKEDLKENKKQTKTLNDVAKRLEQLNKNSAESSKKMIAQLNKKGGDYTKDLVKKNISTPFKSVNMAVQKFAGKLGVVGAVVGGLAASIGFLIGRLKQFSDSFRQVFAMGFRIEQGSMGLAKAAVAAEMSIGAFTEIISKYSTSVGVLGLQSFSELQVSVRNTLQPLGLLGMGLAELEEYTADYIDQLRVAGILEGKTNEQLNEMVTTYAQNITAFSQLANVSRDQIAAVIKGATSVEAFTNRLNTLPDTVQRNVLAAAQTVAGMFAGLGVEFGDQLATTFTTAYGRGGLFFTEAGRELLAVNRRLYNSMSNIIDNMDSLDDGAAAKATADLIDEVANTSEAERERLGLIERSNTQFSGAARQQIQLINQVRQLQENGTVELFKDLQELRQKSQIDKLSKAFINIEMISRKLSIAFNNFLTKLFGNDRIFSAIEKSLESISNTGLKLAEFLLNKAGSIGEGIANTVNQIADWIKSLQGMSFAQILGEVLAKVLVKPFLFLGDVIKQAVSQALKSAMATFFRGKYDDEQETYHKQKNAIQDNFFKGRTRRIGSGELTNEGTDLRELVPALEQQIADVQAGKAKGNIHTLTGELNNAKRLLKQAYDREEERKKEHEAFLQTLRDKYGSTFDPEKSFGYGTNYEGSIIHKNAILEEPETSVTGTTKPGTGNLISNMDPASLSQARMRIMDQYLPMTGSSDPSKTSEGEFYSTSLRLLNVIADNTGGTKKAVDAVNG